MFKCSLIMDVINVRLCVKYYNYLCPTSSTLIRMSHGSLTRYVKLRVGRAPGMPGTFSRHRLQRKPLVSDPGMHHGTCVTHVSCCMSGSLTLGGMRNPQFYVSGKRPIVDVISSESKLVIKICPRISISRYPRT